MSEQRKTKATMGYYNCGKGQCALVEAHGAIAKELPSEHIDTEALMLQGPALNLATEALKAAEDVFFTTFRDQIQTLGGASPQNLQPTTWTKSGGEGGGFRLSVGAEDADAVRFLNTASVNVSTVVSNHSGKRRHITALSMIFHPAPAYLPSFHLHASCELTEPTSPGGEAQRKWRLMADLNPSNPSTSGRVDATLFNRAAERALPDAEERALARRAGDRYFQIPALGRRRGIAHLYLEQSTREPGDATGEGCKSSPSLCHRIDLCEKAHTFCEAMIGGYLEMIRAGIRERVVADRPADILDPQDSEHSLVFGSRFERDMQSYYHSLYIMQVLLLDRGTSVGLMAHKDNAVGVLKSLPSTFSLPAAAAIAGKFRGSLGGLADRVIRVLKSAKDPGRITDRDRRELASVVREYFLRRPGILGLQAPLFDPRS